MSPANGKPEPAAEWVAPASLKPWLRNPVKHPEEQIQRIAQSIQEFGFGPPIVARKADRRIIGGHARQKAALRLKMREVPVRFLDLTEEQADALALADRKLHELAPTDNDALAEIAEGFDDAWKDLLGLAEAPPPEPDQVDVTEVDAADVHDEFWMSVRGPLPKQAAALEALKSALEQIEGVEVELGTIEY